MNKYYQVNVEIKTESDTGRIKKVREQYLVDAVSCLDAETITSKFFIEQGNNLDFKIVSVKETKILEVLPN